MVIRCSISQPAGHLTVWSRDLVYSSTRKNRKPFCSENFLQKIGSRNPRHFAMKISLQKIGSRNPWHFVMKISHQKIGCRKPRHCHQVSIQKFRCGAKRKNGKSRNRLMKPCLRKCSSCKFVRKVVRASTKWNGLQIWFAVAGAICCL